MEWVDLGWADGYPSTFFHCYLRRNTHLSALSYSRESVLSSFLHAIPFRESKTFFHAFLPPPPSLSHSRPSQQPTNQLDKAHTVAHIHICTSPGPNTTSPHFLFHLFCLEKYCLFHGDGEDTFFSFCLFSLYPTSLLPFYLFSLFSLPLLPLLTFSSLSLFYSFLFSLVFLLLLPLPTLFSLHLFGKQARELWILNVGGNITFFLLLRPIIYPY